MEYIKKKEGKEVWNKERERRLEYLRVVIVPRGRLEYLRVVIVPLGRLEYTLERS